MGRTPQAGPHLALGSAHSGRDWRGARAVQRKSGIEEGGEALAWAQDAAGRHRLLPHHGSRAAHDAATHAAALAENNSPRIALHRPRTRSTGSGPGAHATPIHGVRPPLHAPASAAAGWRAPCALSRRGCRVCPAGSPLEGRRRQCWRPCRTPPPPHVCYPRARRGRQLLGAPRRLLLCPVTRRDLLEGDRLEVLEV